jgi:methionyl-tRNA synthetase
MAHTHGKETWSWWCWWRRVFAHGFVNGKDGRKMSKSLGNVVDPHDLLGRYPVDSFRFYLTKDPFGGDVSFNEDALVAYHNGELADVLVCTYEWAATASGLSGCV